MAQELRFVGGTNYAEEDIAEVYQDFYGTNFVLPVAEGLEAVTSGVADGRITVGTGVAHVFGQLYENTGTKLFTLSAQGGGQNRIDAVCLRYNAAGNIIQLTLVEGTPAAVPDPPALTDQDFLLWHIYVPDGFDGSLVESYHIYDKRVFYHPSPISQIYSIENVGINPELLAYSDKTSVPDYWDVGAGTPSYGALDAPVTSTAPRGRSFSVALDATEAVDWVCDPPPVYTEAPGSTVCTLKGHLRFLAAGPVDVIVYYDYGAVSTATLTQKRYYPQTTNTHYDFIMRFNLDYATYATSPRCLRVRFYSPAGSTEIEINPMILVSGYVPGPFRQKHEVLHFDVPVTDAAWDLGDAIAAGEYEIDLSAAFDGRILRGTRGLFGLVYAKDSNSVTVNAGETGVKIQNRYGGDTAIHNIQGEGNSKQYANNFWVSVFPSATWGFNVTAMPLGTLNVGINITGIIT